VDSNGGSDSNDGSSWGSALQHLQTALNRASSNTEIWVAEGTYYPDEGEGTTSDDPTSTFQLPNRVSIYGGFSGSESQRSQRAPNQNPVVLSGDISQDDTDLNEDDVIASPSDIDESATENARHVVDASGAFSRSLIDGVTITGGSADGTGSEQDGGGVYADQGAPTLKNVRIIGNEAARNGGGIASVNGGGPTLRSVDVVANRAGEDGGGLYFEESSVRATYVDLRSNTADGNGGGVFIRGGNIRITSATIEGNRASGAGGGVLTYDAQRVFLVNAIVVGNQATSGGGFWDGPNNFFATSETTIAASTFAGNCGLDSGGAIQTLRRGLNVRNSILWGNEGSGCTGRVINDVQNLLNTLTSSIVEGGLGGALNDNPQYIDAPTLASSGPTTDGNVQIQPSSPAVNGADKTERPQDVADVDGDGNTTELLPLDRSGSPRVRDGEMDIGALEGSTLNLAITGTLGADGSDAGWRDFGVPVQGATVADVQRATGAGLKSMAKWGGWRYVDDKWTKIQSSDPLPVGRGVSVYFTDRNESAINPSLTLTADAGSIIGATDVVVGDGSPSGDGPLSETATWHFLANPYAVPYDLATLESTESLPGFQTVVQIWDVQEGYKTINLDPVGTTDKTGIATWQAFFLERTPGSSQSSVRFSSSGRLPPTSLTNPFFGTKAETESREQGALITFRVTARAEDGSVLHQDNAANLRFHPSASVGWDRYDATKLTPLKSEYAVVGPVGMGRAQDTTMKAQESRPLPSDGEVTIPLGLKTQNYSGVLSLGLDQTSNLPKDWTMTLVDTKGTAQTGDDVEFVLGEGDSEYKFRVGSKKKDQGPVTNTSSRSVQEAPEHPTPIDWSPPSRSAETRSKTISQTPRARFKLRINTKQRSLPVEMAGFEAEMDGEAVQLRWNTASETNNAGFHVQHQRLPEGDSTVSAEGWETLGFVEGAGTTSQKKSYRFETNTLEYGSHAFRLL